MTNTTRHSEGPVARTIEQQTAKLPSDTFLWLAIGSIAASLALKLAGRNHGALFVGQWAPTFLILGLYNKTVKQQGSDRTDDAGTGKAPEASAGLAPESERPAEAAGGDFR